jgi:excisionase family DNA binding protein
MDDTKDLIPVPEAARRAGVARNTMRLAAKNGTIKAVRLGRDWYVHASDIERWKRDNYRPNMAHSHQPKNEE